MVKRPKRKAVRDDIIVVAPDPIIHLRLDGKHYSCMRACSTTDSKSTRWVHEVTCQNCLQAWEKGAQNA